MIRKIITTVLAIFISSVNCYAEGQSGLDNIYRIGYFFGVFMFISIYTIIGGIIIKFILKKNNLLLENQTFKAYLISLLISIFAAIAFGDSFIFLFWNYT